MKAACEAHCHTSRPDWTPGLLSSTNSTGYTIDPEITDATMNWTTARIAARNKFVSVFPALFDAALHARLAFKTLPQWSKNGWELPLPSVLKRAILKRFAIDHGLEILVETGTYLGDTPWAFREYFKKIYTIELSESLARLARARFASFGHIEVLQGDSGAILPTIISKLDAPTLFWLDGHYSGGVTAQGTLNSPITQEINTIVDSMKSLFVVLIDDARSFGQEIGYPPLNSFIAQVCQLLPNHQVAVTNDIITIAPPL